MSVFTAVRLLPTEQSNNDWVATSSKTIAFEDKEHVFDHVFSAHNNVEVYDSSCRMIVERIIEGFNGTIAAYGQSGAGKTHSLLGTNDEKGVLQLAGSHLLRLINKRLTVQYMVKMSAFEIYNETLVDLLDESDSNSCRIIGDKVVGGVEEIVESNEHFLEICQKAQAHRRVGETKLNQKSSRSHAVFQLIVESCHLDVHTRKQSTTVSKLVVLDLAGSENARTMSNSIQSAESRKINLSLLALSRVISDLADNPANKCLPFRDSLLTRILKPVLGGNSHFLLLCCIRKSASSETASTISFGQKAKKMPNHAKKNIATGEAALPALIAQITDLKLQLEKQKKENADQTNKLRLEELLKKVLNSEPDLNLPIAEKPKRRHSIALGGSSIRARISDPKRHSNMNGLFRLDEEELELDSGRSSPQSGRSSRMSVEERLLSHIDDSKSTQTDFAYVEKSSYEEMVKISEDLKGKLKELEEQFEQQRIEWQSVHEGEVEMYARNLAGSEKRLLVANVKIEALEMELTRKDEEHRARTNELVARAEKYEDMYSNLEKRGRQMLDGKDEKVQALVAEMAQKDKEYAKMKKDLQQKIVEVEKKYTDMKKNGLQMLKEKQETIDNQQLEIDRLIANESKRTEEQERVLRETHEKATNERNEVIRTFKASLDEERMKRKELEELNIACNSERKVLREKLEEMTIPVRGLKRAPNSSHCSDPGHALLASKCDILTRQRDLLITNINQRTNSQGD